MQFTTTKIAAYRWAIECNGQAVGWVFEHRDCGQGSPTAGLKLYRARTANSRKDADFTDFDGAVAYVEEHGASKVYTACPLHTPPAVAPVSAAEAGEADVVDILDAFLCGAG